MIINHHKTIFVSGDTILITRALYYNLIFAISSLADFFYKIFLAALSQLIFYIMVIIHLPNKKNTERILELWGISELTWG